jgi:hypothetical protein
MNELQTDRWDRLLRKVSGIAGAAIAPSWTPELAPVFIVEPAERPELEFLRGHRRFGLYATSPAVAARISALIVYPAQARTLIVIERIHVRLLTTGIVCSTNLTGYANIAPLAGAQALDTRYAGQPTNAAWFTADIAAQSSSDLLAANEVSEQPYVVASGVTGPAFHLVGTAVNTAVTASIVWREREFEKGE